MNTSPFTLVWSVDWTKYRSAAFEAWFSLELAAVRYAEMNRREQRRQKNLRKYGLPNAA